MREHFIKYLFCPECREDLQLVISEKEDDKIKTGDLKCSSCNLVFPIINFIPRFVPVENYATSFGLQWNIHSKTQYDDYSSKDVSKERFFNETKWSSDLEGEIILEVGSGSGRFTGHAASTKAMVISMDYSFAVEANYKSNGDKENVFIVQGDIYKMPFRRNYFDKLFCIGVLQHTPDPHKSFMSLPQFLKKDGKLVIDMYKKMLRTLINTKYWVRPFTKDIEPQKLYNGVVKYINFMWPFFKIVSKIPKIGRQINWQFLIPDYTKYGLKGEALKEWAILDCYDMLSPQYDYPQSLRTMKKWFEEAKLKDIDVHYGYNGIEGRGTV